jgi:methylated-DNA-protein-cysteine methyltransferase-like protein
MKSQGRLFEEFDEPGAETTAVEVNANAATANAATDERVIAQVHEIAKAIPPGRVLSYGAVGARCKPPISGYICGRIMIHSHESVPWWRVVGKDGALRISKRNPLLARDQRDKLEAEGVAFDESGRVKMNEFADD